MSLDTADIIRRFDALHLHVKLFSCSDGTVGAEAPGVDIRAGHTLRNLCGYGETAETAVLALWREVLAIDSDEQLRVKMADGHRYYGWNGSAWKEQERVNAD